MASRYRSFTAFGFAWRLVAALFLVLATYNPSGFSYFHWVRDAFGAGDEGVSVAFYVFAGILILIGWTILLVATRSSLGTLGVLLGAALMAAAVWVLWTSGILDPTKGNAFQWIILICLGFLLAIGLSWSHIWRRLTGQVDITDDDQ